MLPTQQTLTTADETQKRPPQDKPASFTHPAAATTPNQVSELFIWYIPTQHSIFILCQQIEAPTMSGSILTHACQTVAQLLLHLGQLTTTMQRCWLPNAVSLTLRSQSQRHHVASQTRLLKTAETELRTSSNAHGSWHRLARPIDVEYWSQHSCKYCAPRGWALATNRLKMLHDS